MPSGRQSYDDENLYKKLTVKELNEYTGTERVSYGGRLASKLSVTLFLPVPSSKKKKKNLSHPPPSERACSQGVIKLILDLNVGHYTLLHCASVTLNRTPLRSPFCKIKRRNFSAALLISCLPGVYRICFMGIGRRSGSVQVLCSHTDVCYGSHSPLYY